MKPSITGNQLVVSRRLMWLMSGQSLFLVAMSINRLTGISEGYVYPNEFLRWKEFYHLFLPIISMLLTVGMWRCLISVRQRSHWSLEGVFFGSIYLCGVAYGLHELANYLGMRFRGSGIDDPLIREIIRFNDDDFSHWVFFAAFAGMNLPLAIWQRINPFEVGIGPVTWIGVLLNALFISGAIFFNLTRGEIGYDLWVVSGVALSALLLQIRQSPQLMLIYQIVGLGGGLLAALLRRGLG